MNGSSIDERIRERVEIFVDELTELVRSSALEAIGAALGEPAPSSRSRGQATPGPKPGPKPGRKPGRPRRSGGVSADVVLSAIRSEPGRRVDEIARDMGKGSKDLKTAVIELLESGDIRKEGQRRGTRYYVGSGVAPRPAATKKRKRRKRS